jgi:hypothetical protein
MVRTVEPLAVLMIRTLVRSSFAAYAMLASKRGCVICASDSEQSCVIRRGWMLGRRRPQSRQRGVASKVDG